MVKSIVVLRCSVLLLLSCFISTKLSVSMSFIFSNLFPVYCLSLKGAKVLVISLKLWNILISLMLWNILITGYLLNHFVISSLVYFLPVAFYIFSASCFLV